MPLSKVRRATKKNCRANMSRNIKLLMDEGRPQAQAIAIAYKKAREGGCRLPDTRGKRASKRGMAFGTADKIAQYAPVFRWPDRLTKNIVEVIDGPRYVGTVVAVASATGPTKYKVRVFDRATGREDMDVSFKSRSLSEAKSHAEAHAYAGHVAGERQKLVYTPPGTPERQKLVYTPPGAPERQKLVYTPPGAAERKKLVYTPPGYAHGSRRHAGAYVLWDNYFDREIGESEKLETVVKSAEAYARSKGYPKPHFKKLGGRASKLWEDLDASGGVRLTIYQSASAGYAAGRSMEVMSPEFMAHRKKRGVDIESAVARAKHKTAAKKTERQRQAEIRSLLHDYDAFIERGMLAEAAILRRAVYALQRGQDVTFTLPMLPHSSARGSGRAFGSAKRHARVPASRRA